MPGLPQLSRPVKDLDAVTPQEGVVLHILLHGLGELSEVLRVAHPCDVGEVCVGG